MCVVFFFQAEDGIRDATVTGVQTCALPISEAVARQHLIAPVALSNGSLRIAQANPFDVIAVDELQRLTGRHIEVEGATRSDVLRLIDRSYGDQSEMGSLVSAGLSALDAPLTDEAVGESPIVKLIEVLLNDTVV